MAAEILRPAFALAHNASGANLVSGRRLDAARRVGRRARAVRGRRGRAARGRGADQAARACASATSSATSSTATASSSSSQSAGAARCRGAAAHDARSSSTATTRSSASSRASAPERVVVRRSTTRGCARPSLQHAADSKYCVRCGTPYEYAAAYVGHLGDYRCPACGHARPALDVAARDIELRGLDARDVLARRRPKGRDACGCALPGLYNVYNALAAAALARALGVDARRTIAAGSSASAPRSGASSGSRSATGSVLMLLIKNPAGANEAVRTLVDGGAAAPRGRRAERRDRRRQGRLVDLGRRLRAAARRARAARRHRRARGRARAALQVRGLRRRPDRGRPGSRARPSTAGSR